MICSLRAGIPGDFYGLEEISKLFEAFWHFSSRDGLDLWVVWWLKWYCWRYCNLWDIRNRKRQSHAYDDNQVEHHWLLSVKTLLYRLSRISAICFESVISFASDLWMGIPVESCTFIFYVPQEAFSDAGFGILTKDVIILYHFWNIFNFNPFLFTTAVSVAAF